MPSALRGRKTEELEARVIKLAIIDKKESFFGTRTVKSISTSKSTEDRLKPSSFIHSAEASESLLRKMLDRTKKILILKRLAVRVSCSRPKYRLNLTERTETGCLKE